ncbi:MAG: c-type cytochrome [Candidatus Krumholzibacteriota bacterium]
MKIKLSTSAAVVGLLLAALATGSARAEVPDTFTNLKVFPKDIGKRQLMGAMRDFSMSLGVRCTYCHVQKTPGDFDSIDWVSDDLEHKEAARGMMTMVRNINSELLPNATGKQGAKVKCITCHRGLEDPRTLDVVMLDTIEKNGADVGIARYRELREEYFGSGSYDFSPATLTRVAENLAQVRGDMDGAVKVLDMGAEMNPEDVPTHLMRCQILILEGDKEGARASAQEALRLDPGNQLAAKLLEQVKN